MIKLLFQSNNILHNGCHCHKFNVASQSSVDIVNLRFFSDFFVILMYHSTIEPTEFTVNKWMYTND